jgi:hypothetical protein
MSILFGVVVACSDASQAPPPATAENAERVVHDHYRLWYRDFDRDGHGDPEVTVRGLVRPDGYVGNATDCRDHNAAISPTAPEACANNLDDDCDGEPDEDCAIWVAEADLTVGIDREDARLGQSTASADLDADGTADLAIGAVGGLGAVGSVYLLYGPANGSVAAPDLASVSASTANTLFGSGVGAGDANGDALDDLLVAANGDSYLFLGPVTVDRSTSDADAELVGEGSFWYPPRAAVTADFDGDSRADLVVTAPDDDEVFVTGGTASGTLDLETDATYTFRGTDDEALGASIAETGDTNGDGIADLALGAPDAASGGRVYIVPGGTAPGSYDAADVATATFTTRAIPSYLGYCVASGDYDGDGATDLFAGAWSAPSSAGVDYDGAVYGYLGPLSGSISVSDASVRWEPANYDFFGVSVAVDDLDGDGAQDVAMSEEIGRVYVQLGYATGVVDVATLFQFQAPHVRYAAYLGVSITPIPDWTGDGGSELALGARGVGGRSTEGAGAVYVFFSEIF